MKISIATTGKQGNSMIPSKLSTAKELFIVDVDNLEVLQIYDAPPLDRDIAFAKYTVEHDCEAIICGQIKREAFNILYEEGVSRYNGTGKTANEAIRALLDYKLNMITDCIGGTGCVGSSSGGECHDHEHDHEHGHEH